MGDRGRGPPNIEGMVSLKVDNLSYRNTGLNQLLDTHVFPKKALLGFL